MIPSLDWKDVVLAGMALLFAGFLAVRAPNTLDKIVGACTGPAALVMLAKGRKIAP